MQHRVSQEILFLIDHLDAKLQNSSPQNLRYLEEHFQEVVNISELKTSSNSISSLFYLFGKVQEITSCLREKETAEEASLQLKKIAENVKKETKALKIAFFVHEFSLWPSFQTIWEACGDDIDKSIVFVYWLGRPLTDIETEKYLKPYHEAGYEVRTMAEYCVEIEQPDIVFYMKPYYGFRGCPDAYYVTDVEKITPYTIFVSYCLDVQGGELLQKYFYGLPFFYHVWRIIGYSDFYRSKMIERGFRNAENVTLLGHPKFDVSYVLDHEKRFIYPDWQEKANGRKLILWNTHFSVEPGQGVGTYFRWKSIVFAYFREHKDIVLLWRPHPLFWEQIVKAPGIVDKEFQEFISGLEQQDNVIVDRTGDYRYAFCMTDALISDATTFLVEYAASSKPILYTVKQDGEKICNEDYLAGIKVAAEDKDMVTFLDDVRLNRIDAAATRKNREMFESVFGKCDGKVGKRILQYVRDEVDRDIRMRAQKRLLALETEDKDGLE